jgi:hypothetical protein
MGATSALPAMRAARERQAIPWRSMISKDIAELESQSV